MNAKIVIESDLRANVHFFALINYYKLSSRGASRLASLGLNKRSKVDFTVGNIYIYFTNISEGTAFLLQGLTYNDKVKLRCYSLK